MAYVAAYVPCTALLFAIRLHVANRDERDLPVEWYVHPFLGYIALGADTWL